MENNKEITDVNQIDCVGVDNKIHVCTSWESKTKCGIKIKKKTVNEVDIKNHFSCYECTY